MQATLTQAIQLLQAWQLGPGRQVLRKLAKTAPKDAVVQHWLGQAERALGNMDDAVSAHQRAVQLAPNEPVLREHLAMALTYSNRGRNMLPAIECYAQLLRQYPQAEGAQNWAINAQTLALRSAQPAVLREVIAPYCASQPSARLEQLRLSGGLCIAAFLAGDFAEAATHAQQVLALRDQTHDAQGNPIVDDKYFYSIYAGFIRDLLAWHAANPTMVAPAQAQPVLHVIGESHSLTAHGLSIAGHRVQAQLIMGAKAYFFGVPVGEAWQYSFEQCLRRVPAEAPVMVTFGEIDCRPNEGIMQQCINNPAYALEQEIEKLVRGYVKFLHKAKGRRRGPVIVSGVPAPAEEKRAELTDDMAPRFARMIATFNQCLAAACADYGFTFMDVYAHTNRGDSWAKRAMHLDGVHLNPSVLVHLLHDVIAARMPAGT